MKQYNKILHHVNTFLPTYGGKTNRIYNLTHNDGNFHLFQVPNYNSVNCKNRNLKSTEIIDNYSINRHCIEHIASINFPIFGYMVSYASTILNAYRISQWPSPEPIDQVSILYGHSPIEFGLASILMAKRYNLPCIYEVHGLDHYKTLVKRNSLKLHIQFYLKYIHTLIEKYIIKSADAVIAQTNTIKKKIIQIYGIDPDKIQVVYNGVDNTMFTPDRYTRQANEMRLKNGWGDKIVVMYSGFLDDINGIDFLVHAIANLPDQLSRMVQFVFMGRGHYAKTLEQLAASRPNVEFLGIIDYEKMPLMMACADVFTIPRPSSFPSETLVPLKLIEAMAMGKILLVSDVGGMTEVIKNNVSGVVFKNGDEKDYIRKLYDIADNLENFTKIGLASKILAHNSYSWEASRTILNMLYSHYIVE